MANNAISSIESKKSDSSRLLLVALIVTSITLIALLLGWFLKSSVEARVQVQQHAGVKAIPHRMESGNRIKWGTIRIQRQRPF
jgi:hypothetical protein